MASIIDMVVQPSLNNTFFGALEQLGSKAYKSFIRSIDVSHSNYAQGVCELTLNSGFSMVTADNVAPDPQPKSFAFKKSPIVFSVSLSGYGVVKFFDDSKREIHVCDNDLYIGYAPNTCGETVSMGKEQHSSVMLIADPQFLQDIFGTKLIQSLPANFVDIILKNGQSLHAESLPAPPQAIALADKVMRSTLAPDLFKVFAYSTGIEMLCLILDHLQECQKTKKIPLTQDDISKLNQVRMLMKNNIVTPPSLQDLCREVGINEFKLKRGFKQVFGTTVFGYLQKQRVKTAYLAMINDGKNVSECAWDVGYTNVSHFIAAFRKHFGVTPGAVAKGFRMGCRCR
ncbi:helix-turn-helix domain-containing protein [Oleidesulfovibrio sp.]|uniref:helix-turn-helix domain-containing protein n=1 Tax=Oleidesulfovibrio sp. TaxID=2909707 RepID=UPI003A891EA6